MMRLLPMWLGVITEKTAKFIQEFRFRITGGGATVIVPMITTGTNVAQVPGVIIKVTILVRRLLLVRIRAISKKHSGTPECFVM